MKGTTTPKLVAAPVRIVISILFGYGMFMLFRSMAQARYVNGPELAQMFYFVGLLLFTVLLWTLGKGIPAWRRTISVPLSGILAAGAVLVVESLWHHSDPLFRLNDHRFWSTIGVSFGIGCVLCCLFHVREYARKILDYDIG